MAEADPYAVVDEEDDDDCANDEDDEAFQDAYELRPISESMDLESAIADVMISQNLFFNNRFEEAKTRLEPWADRSFYHALGYGTILYLQATMTFERSDIEKASKAVKRSMAVCSKFRRKTSILNRGKINYNKLTREEVHAEVCYAESMIERAFLTFIQDETLIGFVTGALKIRACYHSYKECLQILDKRDWKPDDVKSDFESGVRLGVGLFNLMISLLPTKIMKLLEFAGFSGNKNKGLEFLESGTNMLGTLRGPLCSLSLLGYHTVVIYVLGTANGDMDLADRILKPCLQRFPKGALFLFFAGKIAEIKGQIPKAIQNFEASVDAQSEWKQFHHFNYWELMWCNSFEGDWLLAMKFAEKLCKDSRWSKATYTYQKAVFLLMCDDQTPETKKHIDLLLKEVPKFYRRIAGKSIPFEKFVMKKAKRYFAQGHRLTLPAYELIYVWNGFALMKKSTRFLRPILENVQADLNKLEANKADYPYYADDLCLAQLLKGVCLRYLGQITEAEQCLLGLCTQEKQVKEDTYLIPYALVELGFLNIDKGDSDTAISFLDMAKKHSKYALESRLHFRIHAAKLELQYKMGKHEDDISLGELAPLSKSTSKEDKLKKIELELSGMDLDEKL